MLTQPPITLLTVQGTDLLQPLIRLGQLAAAQAGKVAEIECDALRRSLDASSQWLLQAIEVRDADTLSAFLQKGAELSQALNRGLLEDAARLIGLTAYLSEDMARILTENAHETARSGSAAQAKADAAPNARKAAA